MNWGRGRLRLWLVASLAWMALQIVPSWHIVTADLRCMFDTDIGPWCSFRLVGGLEDPQFWETLLLPPIALLAESRLAHPCDSCGERSEKILAIHMQGRRQALRAAMIMQPPSYPS